MAEQLSINVKEGTCADGCGEPVNKGRTYKQGHDARLRGILGRAYKAGMAVKLNGKATTAEAELKAHGFPIPPEAKPRKPRVRKPAAKKAAAKKSTAKKNTKPATTRKPRVAKDPNAPAVVAEAPVEQPA